VIIKEERREKMATRCKEKLVLLYFVMAHIFVLASTKHWTYVIGKMELEAIFSHNSSARVDPTS